MMNDIFQGLLVLATIVAFINLAIVVGAFVALPTIIPLVLVCAVIAATILITRRLWK